MHETILSLAGTLSGAKDTEASLLELLCTAQEQAWSERLREGIKAEDCREAYCCASAFSAVADLMAGRCGEDGGVTSFRAGDVSVKKDGASEAGFAADNLRRQAERLMAPYVCEDTFCFRGVRA
jgi:hypothetical protein